MAGWNWDQEQKFKDWYNDYAMKTGLDPNPDDPRHMYDYRGWFEAQQRNDVQWAPMQDPTDNNRLHGPSNFKTKDHPTRFGINDGQIEDRVTGKPYDLMGAKDPYYDLLMKTLLQRYEKRK